MFRFTRHHSARLVLLTGLGLGLALAQGAAHAAAAPARGATPAAVAPEAVSDSAQRAVAEMFTRMQRAVTDPQEAPGAVKELRNYLAGNPDTSYTPYAHLMLVQALISAQGPLDQIGTEADIAEKVLPARDEIKASFYASVSQALTRRGFGADRALRYAQKALALCPTADGARQMRSLLRSVLGQAQIQSGLALDAVKTLNAAIVDSPDSQNVLYHLGRAYQAAKQPERAIGAYVRSIAVFAHSDTLAAAPLRELWRKQHGSLAGLDARIATATRASRDHVAFAGRRLTPSKTAPYWQLPDLDETLHTMKSYAGKVVVMDFWGSWCGPCRMELPLVEALYQRYKGNPKIAFIGINWERTEDALQHRKLARDYVAQNRLSFPMMYDHEHRAVEAYQIQGFPTLFVIDATGQTRFVNVGYDPATMAIVGAQIESLLE